MIQPGEKLASPEVCEAEELFFLFVLLSSILDGVRLCTTHYLEISHVSSSHLFPIIQYNFNVSWPVHQSASQFHLVETVQIRVIYHEAGHEV